MNPVLECIYTRRSVRNYLDKPVLREVINELLNAAVMAPSAMNTQPWRFSIVTNTKKIKEYSDLILKKKDFSSGLMKVGVRFLGSNSIFYNAPLLIIISGKKSYSWLYHDINLAVQNMFLAAHSLGIGSCYIGFAKSLNNMLNVRKELGLSDKDEIVATLVFGYPKTINRLIPKRKVKILRWIE